MSSGSVLDRIGSDAEGVSESAGLNATGLPTKQDIARAAERSQVTFLAVAKSGDSAVTARPVMEGYAFRPRGSATEEEWHWAPRDKFEDDFEVYSLEPTNYLLTTIAGQQAAIIKMRQMLRLMDRSMGKGSYSRFRKRLKNLT